MIAEIFSDGGIVMYILVIAFLIGIVLSIIQFVKRDRIDLLPVIRGHIIGTIMLGFIGFIIGLIMCSSGLDRAPLKYWMIYFFKGVSISLYPVVLSLIVAGILAIFYYILLTIHVNKTQ